MSIGFSMKKSLLLVSIAGLSILLLAGGISCVVIAESSESESPFTAEEQEEIDKFCAEFGSDVHTTG